MAVDAEYREITELVELQFVNQPRRNDGQIRSRVDLRRAFDGCYLIHRGANRHMDKRRRRRDLAVVPIAAHLRNAPGRAKSAVWGFAPAGGAWR